MIRIKPSLSWIIGTLVIAAMSSTVHAQTYGSKLCKNNDAMYSCYKVKKGDSWSKLFPDEEERDLAMRINRTNKIYPGMTIALPNDQEYNSLDYSPFKRQIDAPGEKVIMVSLDKLAFGAYDSSGELEYWGPVSGGKGYCPDIGRACHTSRGKFEIYRKSGSSCASTKFPVGRGGAPMPYCMFFNGGFALHGSADVPGYNASHGCVRLFTKDAKWLNQEFVNDEKVTVIIE